MIPEDGYLDECKAAVLKYCERMPQLGEVFEFGTQPSGKYQAELTHYDEGWKGKEFAFTVCVSSVDVWAGMVVYIPLENWLGMVANYDVHFVRCKIDDLGIFIEPIDHSRMRSSR